MDDDLPGPDATFFLVKMADEARKLMPASQARLDKLRMMLAAEQLTYARLQQAAAFDGNEAPLATTTFTMQPSDPMKLGEYLMRLFPQGAQTNARDALFQVLLVHKDGEGLKVNEIQAALRAANLNVADSTLYAYLRDGKNDDIFKNENGRWALTDKGVKTALGFDEDLAS